MNAELKLGSILFVLTAFLWFYAIPYQIEGSTQALFPRILTACMTIPCIMLFFQGFQSHKAGDNNLDPVLFHPSSLKALMVVPLMLVYIVLIPVVGFYVTTFLFIPVFMFFFGYRKWLLMAAFSIALPAVVYVVIRKVLSFPFPEGLFF